jgi:hypothetical protein
MKMTLPQVKIALILALIGLCSSCNNKSPEERAQARAALESEMKTAIEKVIEIVNQPVTRLVRKESMEVATYRPGWFHEGASKPDYNSVDVRKTRETPYGKHKYVTSDITPGFAFLGSELEFNPMTKYFYIDYNLPKKKLSDAEMEEVNRLYRIIDRCEKDLANL